MDDEQSEHTEETIKRAQKDFALDLPMLVDETTRDVKILSAIAALEKNQPEDIFYPYCPHISHLTTRFGLLFYNDKIIIPENMRTTIIAMLHQGHPSATKTDQLAAAFCWSDIYQEFREKAENFPSCRASGKNLVTQVPSTEKTKLEILSEPNQEIQLGFAGPKNQRLAATCIFRWPLTDLVNGQQLKFVKIPIHGQF